MIERRATRRSHSASEQPDLPEIIPARKISEHQFAAGYSSKIFTNPMRTR